MTDDPEDRREHPRFDVSIEVDCRSEDNFLFAYIQNISAMGIFIRSETPLPVGTWLDLRFDHEGQTLTLRGQVVWVNPYRGNGENLNPGMGVHFAELTAETRDRVLDLVRAIAYIQDESN
jgi:type IV pilus assembly protein PilZ